MRKKRLMLEAYVDFMKHFDRLDICHLTPDALINIETVESGKKWNLLAYEGEWISGLSAGGCFLNPNTFHKNPQYFMKLEHPDEDEDFCSVVISLMQKNRRGRHAKSINFLQIGFVIYPISERDLVQKPLKRDFFESKLSISDSPFMNLRTVSCRFQFLPGHYLVVPSTLGPDEEAEFLIRIYYENNQMFEEHDGDIGIREVDNRVIKDLHGSTFEKLSVEKLFLEISGADQEIYWMELKQLLDFICYRDDSKSMENGYKSKSHQNGSTGFSKDICRSIVAMLDIDQSGKLGLDEFRTFLEEFVKWRAVFRLYDKDQNNKLDSHELRDAFESAGYRLNNQIINFLIYRYGTPDKAIPFDDFIMCAVKIKTMFEHFKVKDHGNMNQALFTLNEWILSTLYS